MTHTATTNETANREIVITRLLNAPQSLVYEAWTDPRHVIQWWGPNGFTNTFHEMEVKPGGVWDFIMHGPDGTDYPNRIIFKEVDAPHRLAYAHGSGVENDPQEFDVVVTFEPQGDKTLLTMRSVFRTQEARDFVVREFGAIEGGNQTVNRLEEHLRNAKPDSKAEKELTITRIFNAPRELVFKAWTDPEHASCWWGPDGFTNPVFKWNAHAGGSIVVHMKAPDGVVYPMDGMFREVVENEKLVFLSAALDNKGNRMFEILNTVTLEDSNGSTKLTISASAFNVTAAASPYLEGMEMGWKQSLDRLDGEVGRMMGNPSDPDELIITRIFNAPRELVFEAWTQAEHLAKWWGPKEMSITSLSLDLKPGGMLLYCMSGNGMEMWGKFIYHEIVAPERMVFVNSFADKDGNTVRAPFSGKWPLEIRNVLTLSEHRGKTLLTLRGGPVNASAEEMQLFREMNKSMQQGFSGTFEQLDAFLVTLQTNA